MAGTHEADENTLYLGREADSIDMTDAERERQLIRDMFKPLRDLFVWTNAIMLLSILAIILFETITGKTSSDRLVTSGVLKTLIGATTVQLGTIVLAVMRELMKRGTNSSSP